MRRRPGWVVDTNVLVSAFLWQGKPERVVEMDGEKQVQLVTSRALRDVCEPPLVPGAGVRHCVAESGGARACPDVISAAVVVPYDSRRHPAKQSSLSSVTAC